MKKIFLAIMSVIYALIFTPQISAYALEDLDSDGVALMRAYQISSEISEIDEEEAEQQVENNLVYTEITEAYTNNQESIAFDYAGGYINEDNNLVICVAGDELTNEEVSEELENICLNNTSDVIIEQVEHSYDDLNKARESFENDLENNLYQADIDGNINLYELLSSIKSNAIDDENNRVVVFVPELNENKINLLNKTFGDNDIISYENVDGNDTLKASVHPGRAIFGVAGGTRDNNPLVERFSIGYRARYTRNGTTYYGFCTSGHAAESLAPYEGRIVYTDESFSDSSRIGNFMTWNSTGTADAGFVRIWAGTTFYNNYSTIPFVGYKYMVNIAQNTKVWKIGSTTGWTAGYLVYSDASTTLDDHYMTHQYLAKINAAHGDSGGIFYTWYNPDGAGGYLVAGVLVGGNDEYNYFSKCPNIKNLLNIEPY